MNNININLVNRDTLSFEELFPNVSLPKEEKPPEAPSKPKPLQITFKGKTSADTFSASQRGSYKCASCSEMFTSMQALTDHRDLHHLMDPAKPSHLKVGEKQHGSGLGENSHFYSGDDNTVPIKKNNTDIKYRKRKTTGSTLRRTLESAIEESGNLWGGSNESSYGGEKPYTGVKRSAELDSTGKEKKKKLEKITNVAKHDILQSAIEESGNLWGGGNETALGGEKPYTCVKRSAETSEVCTTGKEKKKGLEKITNIVQSAIEESGNLWGDEGNETALGGEKPYTCVKRSAELDIAGKEKKKRFEMSTNSAKQRYKAKEQSEMTTATVQGLQFQEDVMLLDDDLSFVCNICNGAFFSEEHLEEHKRVKHVQTSEGSANNVLHSDISEHKSAEDGDSGKPAKKDAQISCSECKKKFCEPFQLQMHMNKKHPEVFLSEHHHPRFIPKRIACPYCPKIFGQTMQIAQHVRDKHSEHSHRWIEDQQNLAHICKVCSAGFRQEDLLKKHVQAEHPEEYSKHWEKYFCPPCNKGFVDTDALIDHLRVTHKEDYEEYEKEKDRNPFIFGQQCLICLEYCIDTPALAKHAEVHKDATGFFRCGVHCDLACTQVHEIQNHYLQKRLKFYQCRRCDIEYSNRSNWMSHNAKHHGYNVELLGCEICGEKFCDGSALKRHYRNKHPESKKLLQCTVCGPAYFNFEDPYKKHIIKRHCESVRVLKFVDDNRFQCTLCDMIFEDVNPFLEHCSLKHELDKKKDASNTVPTTDCDKNPVAMDSGKPKIGIFEPCLKNFLERFQVQKHVQKKPSGAENPQSEEPPKSSSLSMKCPHCSKVSAQSKDIDQHIRIKHPEHYHLREEQHSVDQKNAAHVCQVCSKAFIQKNLLKNHMRFNHYKEYRQQWEKHVCKVCAKGFTHIDHLVDHLRMTHYKEYEAYKKEKETNPFIYGQQCLVCSEYFVGMDDLKEHAEIHKDASGQFPCSIHCDETFETIDNINIHYLKQRLKFYECRRCDTEYANRNSWRSHNGKHHGYNEGKFACELCDVKFCISYGLKKHMSYMHKEDEKSIRCAVCGAFFSDEGIYKKHMMKKHSDVEKT